MRLYVLLKGVENIEIFLHKEGMARFCTANYEEPTDENLKELYGHLTNFTLNKDSENYINKEGIIHLLCPIILIIVRFHGWRYRN